MNSYLPLVPLGAYTTMLPVLVLPPQGLQPNQMYPMLNHPNNNGLMNFPTPNGYPYPNYGWQHNFQPYQPALMPPPAVPTSIPTSAAAPPPAPSSPARSTTSDVETTIIVDVGSTARASRPLIGTPVPPSTPVAPVLAVSPAPSSTVTPTSPSASSVITAVVSSTPLLPPASPKTMTKTKSYSCSNCKTTECYKWCNIRTKNVLCQNCYAYERAHKKRRPSAVIARYNQQKAAANRKKPDTAPY